jgi:hypothetical protein
LLRYEQRNLHAHGADKLLVEQRFSRRWDTLHAESMPAADWCMLRYEQRSLHTHDADKLHIPQSLERPLDNLYSNESMPQLLWL